MPQLIGLKEFRKAQGLTLERLARELDFSLSYVSQIENGYAAPAYGFMRKIKAAYPEIDINMFFKDAAIQEGVPTYARADNSEK
jgi:transcriptional regulator with XRE-family HTH domain